MTHLKQQISLIPFSIEHWTYKRRRFENRWDQTFCILLFCNRVQTSADAKIWNKSDLDSNSHFRINGCPSNIRSKIVDTLVGVIHFALGSNRLLIHLIVWELRKQRNANKCRKIAYSSVVKKMKNRNPRADLHHHQKSTTSKGSPLACPCQVWSTSVSAFVSYLVYRMTERMKEWQKMIT